MCTHTCVGVHVRGGVCVGVCAWVYLPVFVCVCLHMRVRAYVCVFGMQVCAYFHAYISVDINMCLKAVYK